MQVMMPMVMERHCIINFAYEETMHKEAELFQKI